MTDVNAISTIFVHVPKTAGTTFRAIIENTFPKKQICRIYHGSVNFMGMDEFLALADEDKKKFRIFCGHFEFGLHRKIPQPCKYITVMRNSIERTISLYHHHMQGKHARADKNVEDIHARIKNDDFSLSEFVSSGISFRNTDNGQTRLLSGEAPAFGQCNRTMLDTAKENLRNHFVVTGLTERFDESVLLMQKALGWPAPYYLSQNIATDRVKYEDLPQSTLETIRRSNELDTELYEYAEKLLEEKIARYGAEFEKELEQFRTGNSLYQKKMTKYRYIYMLPSKMHGIMNRLGK